MSATQEDDGQTYLVLGLAVGVITLVLLLVMGVALSRGSSQPPSAPVVAAIPATVSTPGAATVPEGAGIRVDKGVVRFYFASGSTELPPGAAAALTPIIEGVGAGKKAQISGFHDATGDAAVNAAIAQRRAQAVRDVLTGLGVPPAQVDMRKPESAVGTGANAQARRVEVRVVD